MSDQTNTDEPDKTRADESPSETEGAPTKDQRTMFTVEDEELA